jgi:hypothetical protein
MTADDEDRTVRAPSSPSAEDEATRVDPVKPATEEDDPTKVVPKRLGSHSQAHAALKYKPKKRDGDDDDEQSIIVRAARKAREPVPLSILVVVLATLAFMVVRLLRDLYGW